MSARGFAAMTPEQRRAAASKGGASARVHVRVLAMLERASTPEEATVTIDRSRGLFSVRGRRRRRRFELPIADVAALVVRSIIRAEVAAERKRKR